MAHEYDDILRSLPAAYRRDAWVQALAQALQAQDEGQRDAAWDTAAQMFLDSMTWGLDAAEREAGLTAAPGAALADRRSALAAKWRSMTGKCDLALIQQVCDAWDKGEVQAEYDGKEITLRFINRYGVPEALDALLDAVREICPAHLPLAYIIRYRRWSELAARTWGSLAAVTWGNAREGEISGTDDTL